MDRLSAMQVFTEVVDKGSFTAAAKHLDISRVKATRYVDALESWLDIRLIQRTTRSLALTSSGQQFYAHCQDVLALTTTMEQDLANTTTIPGGKLRISATTAFAVSHLTQALVEFQQRYPQVSVDMDVQGHKVKLIDEQVDLAIRIADELDPGLIARRLAPCRSVLCASPSYLKQAGTPQLPAQLPQHRCLLFSHFETHQWQLESHHHDQEKVQVEVSGALKSNDALVLKQAACADAGIARLPRYLVTEQLKNGELIEVLSEWQAKPMSIWGVYPSRKHMPASLQALIEFLADRFNQESEW